MTLRRAALTLIVASLVAGALSAGQQAARFVKEIPWQGGGGWLKSDLHVHSTFSDGGQSIEAIATRAEAAGCDVIAITDHSDRDRKGATKEYFAAIAAARRAHPRLIILAGVEWNIPPAAGDEHVVVLVHPSVEGKLEEFKERFDDYERPTREASLAAEGLRWLATNATVEGILPVAINEHPSRKDTTAGQNVADFERWRSVNTVVVGFSGAAGHQGDTPVGSYTGTFKLIDRWDPLAAELGGAWDTLLGKGLDVWAASAPSDFHTEDPKDINDFWPGEFSETWIDAPTRDASGVLRALRAGAFFGAHGRIVRAAQLTVSASGLSRPARSGETISVSPGTAVTISLQMEIPPKAWAPGANQIDEVEIIAVTAAGARVLARGRPTGTATANFSTKAPVPATGFVLRARGYRVLAPGDRLAFYVNPIRIVTGAK